METAAALKPRDHYTTATDTEGTLLLSFLNLPSLTFLPFFLSSFLHYPSFLPALTSLPSFNDIPSFLPSFNQLPLIIFL
jgi:hypothetical protein